MHRTSVIAVSICALGCCATLQGFWVPHHLRLIQQAFDDNPDARRLAIRKAAQNGSQELDNHENQDSDQYKHWMRPSGMPTADAQTATPQFYEAQIHPGRCPSPAPP
jgi:hypothetical protein